MPAVLAPEAVDADGHACVSVVIVTWNAREALLDCLEALVTNPPSVPWEVIVVDNASSDGTRESVAAAAPWVRVIANNTNRGLPAANNQGIAASAAPYVLIANADTQVGPGAVDSLLGLLTRRPKAAFAIPRLRHPDGSLHISAGDLPTLGDALAGRQIQRRRRQLEGGFWWDGWAHDVERRIGRGHEACYLVRRAAIAEIGLQDEAFFLDWEGIDWTARAHDLGWEVWFTPEAEVVHLGGASIKQVQLRWIVRSHRGMYRYFAKRASPPLRPLLALTFGARAATKSAAWALGLATYERGQGTGSA
jgi:N-acetylglucosaminyl-diphospho-decaprenol L-rhamnosyltransferase